MSRKSRLSWLLFVAGALLLAKGSFALYPYLLSSIDASEVSMIHYENSDRTRFEPGTPLFNLSMPRVNAGFTVVEGTNDSALRTGPGHLEGSPLPGEAGNVVIAGHRDTHFHVLKNVLIGDQIHIGTGTRQYVYRIVDIRIVAPTDTWVLESQSQPTLTLITCYPFRYIGPSPDRYIVQATLVD